MYFLKGGGGLKSDIPVIDDFRFGKTVNESKTLGTTAVMCRKLKVFLPNYFSNAKLGKYCLLLLFFLPKYSHENETYEKIQIVKVVGTFVRNFHLCEHFVYAY